MRLISAKYPELQLPTFKVKFVDGVADVDEETAAAILDYGPDGVRAASDEEPEEDDGQEPHEPPGDGQEPQGDGQPPAVQRPEERAPKADWIAYADTQDPGDHSQLTKAQLVAQYGG